MRHSPHVEDCTLTFVEGGLESLIPSDKSLVLPKLSSLTLKTDGFDISSFFHALRLPSLTHFDIEFRFNDGDGGFESDELPEWPHTSFMSLLERSACAISNLTLAIPISEVCLVGCLRRVSPTLESLFLICKFNWATFGEPTLALLTNHMTSLGDVQSLFPKLKNIIFHDSLQTELAPNVIADMVESRWCFPEDEPQFINARIVIQPSNVVTDTDMRRIKVMRVRGETGEIVVYNQADYM